MLSQPETLGEGIVRRLQLILAIAVTCKVYTTSQVHAGDAMSQVDAGDATADAGDAGCAGGRLADELETLSQPSKGKRSESSQKLHKFELICQERFGCDAMSVLMDDSKMSKLSALAQNVPSSSFPASASASNARAFAQPPTMPVQIADKRPLAILPAQHQNGRSGPARTQREVTQITGLPLFKSSKNAIINGTVPRQFGRGPLCILCGEYGHLKKECTNPPLTTWEQKYMKQIVFGVDARMMDFSAAIYESNNATQYRSFNTRSHL